MTQFRSSKKTTTFLSYFNWQTGALSGLHQDYGKVYQNSITNVYVH